ncbi:MAG TPA: Tex family protein [Polyangiales bacterium]|nr:Tex family protein [Polyangiales bacterium]
MAVDTTSNSPETYDPVAEIAAELKLAPPAISAVLRLLNEGATVPFIARYRKEATSGLDEVEIRNIQERRDYLVELHDRKQSVLAEIKKQGKLTPELEAKIKNAKAKAEVEDLYLPFKPKRRTRATIARERGLEPLADVMFQQTRGMKPDQEAARFVDAAKEVPDIEAALAGARDICAERISELAEPRKRLRRALTENGTIVTSKTREHAKSVTKFDTYAEYSEPLAAIPSHRFLAIRRGESEGVLRVELETDTQVVRELVEREIQLDKGGPWREQLGLAIDDALKRLIWPAAELDVRVELKLKSDADAITVFAQNLRELLLAAPFGPTSVLGIDPGQRTGCKCAMLDGTGKLLANTTIYLVQGDAKLADAKRTLLELVKKFRPRAIAVGNGTHGRETEAFVRDVLREQPKAEGEGEAFCVSVSEAGASVYSASEIAREEFPDLDLTVRGAISIARRLQDPLAELVKIDPKSIGVGQYQHDVHQPALVRKLEEVVETCVNQVGVEVNTASAPLLSHVAGIGSGLAKKIVAHRDANGPFSNRKQLLDVSGLGPRAFEQCAGFLRISGAKNPLDASAVHPERYELVGRMATDLNVSVAQLVSNAALVDRIDLKRYAAGDVGEFTLRDISAELKKPGRDPRASFEPPKFRDDVRTLEDLKPGMLLEGVVTNVTAFGAFVDVGVHQDGLVHVSQLADRFVKNPADVVKVGDRLQVRVLDVDLQRQRIGLSARKDAPVAQGGGGKPAADSGGRNQRPPQGKPGGKPGPAPGKPAPGGKPGAKGDAGEEGLRHNPFADRFRR